MKRVLFLGSNSFTGYHFKKFICNNGLDREYSYIGIDRDDSDNSKYKYIEYRRVNSLDKTSLEAALSDINPDFIMNFIGTFSGCDYDVYVDVNANISRHIFEWIARNGTDIKKVLIIGSAAEYGNVRELPVKECSVTDPVSLYGLSKLIQTNMAKYYYNNYGININVARTFNIVGRGISSNLSIGNFINQINNAKASDIISVGNLKPRRDYLHIDDVVRAYWEILMNGQNGEIYNVCSGKSLSMEDIFNRLTYASGKSLNFETDYKLVKNIDIMDIYGDNSKLISHTKWRPMIDILDKDVLKEIF